MATSMNYSVVARKNPSKKSEPAKYYALAQASGIILCGLTLLGRIFTSHHRIIHGCCHIN